MKIIRAASLGRAHELIIKHILEKGRERRTENGEETLETDEIALRVENPLTEPMASSQSRFKRAFLESYADNLIKGSDAVFEYDYHSRLFDWGQGLTLASGNGAGAAAGNEIHADQIRYIIEKLKSEPVSRRAVAVTWNPAIDETLNDCPCLQLIQCVIRKEKDVQLLDMKVVFRSNDMLSAAGANMYALARLQQHIAEEIGVPVGAYTHISLVPHIYYTRDVADIPPFCGEGTLIRPQETVCAACRGCQRAEGI